MWSARADAAETAAAGRSFARGVSLRSRRVWSPLTLSPSRSCTRLLQLVLSVAFSLQLLLSTDRIPALWCSAAVSERHLLQSFPSGVPLPPEQQSEKQLSQGAAGAFAQLASAAAAALRSSGVTASILGTSEGAARAMPEPLVDGTDWHESIIFDNEDPYAGEEEEEGQTFPPLTTRAVKKFTEALNYFFNTAKEEVRSSDEETPTRSSGEQLPSSSMGWSFQETQPERGDTQGSSSLQKNTTLSGRPAWLLPDHRSSLTRMSVPPRESGTCPAVGGFGHPLGRRYEGLEDWGGLLCRSGGMLRKTNSPDLAYDTFVLVKGYRGGDAPLEENLSSAGDDLSNSGDSISVDDISGVSSSGRRSEKFGVSFDTLASGRAWREKPGSSREAQQKCRESSKECNKNSSPRYRKTDAQLEDELNEVIDTLSMLHCHLANVVDLRHPSNFELYANIRKVALLRAKVLRRRNQVNVRFPDEQGVSDVPVVKQQGQRQNNDIPNTFRSATKNNDADDGGMGVMRGQHSSALAKSTRASYSSRRHGKRDMQVGKFALHETTRGAASGISGLYGRFNLPQGEEENESMPLSTLQAPERLHVERNIRTSLLSSLQDEEDSLPAEEREDDSGPVLVVVRNLTAPERLFFGVREIREFLLSRLLKTAYEIRAYNEFKRHLFALARRKRSLRLSKTAINTKRGLLSRLYSSPAEYSAQERNAAAFTHDSTAAASPARNVTEDQKEATQGSDSTSSSTVELTKKEKRALLAKKFSVTDWLKKGRDTNTPLNPSADERVELNIGQDTFVVPPNETPSTETDRVAPVAGTPGVSVAQRQIRTTLPAWTGLSIKEQEEPWWVHLGLRFDLYISLAGITAERVAVSPTATLLRLVSEPRMRKLVCVYNYDDPKTDIPPILRANGFVGLPALVLGRRLTTGARSIERLLVSIAEYRPPFPYSLEQYAPRFLVTEPIFSEVLASAMLTSKPVMYARTTRVR